METAPSVTGVRALVDIPPVWLAGFLCLSWSAARIFPGLVLDHPALDLIGGLCLGGGVILAALAMAEMRKYRTTVMPHGAVQTLVQSGIFRRSRNPIYLGDALIFLGLTLYWGAVMCLPLLALFLWILLDRFIVPEEARLEVAFPKAFEDYCARTGRWV